MPDPGIKWHQFLLNDKEIELFHELRWFEEEAKQAYEEDANKLRQTLYLLSYAENDRCLGRYHVDASNVIMECAQIGAELRRNIVFHQESEAEVQEEPSAEDNARPTHVDEDEVQIEDEPISWNDVCEDVIPSYVKEVTFSIDEEDLTSDRRRELEERFPGVAMRSTLPTLKLEPPLIVTTEKPKGIKSAVFQLDEAEAEADPRVVRTIRELYPWVTVQREPAYHPIAPLQQSSWREPVVITNPQQHLVDLARYTIKPPGDYEFSFKYQMQAGWESLPISQKFAIAHARAIQGSYGYTNSLYKRCTHCTNRDYVCRVYHYNMVRNSKHMDLGRHCQNCRVWGQECDVFIPPKERGGRVQDISNLETLDRSSRHLSADQSSEATTSPEPAAPAIDVASRITRDAAPGEESKEIDNEKHDMPEARLMDQGSASNGIIQAYADKIGLVMNDPEFTLHVYTQWSHSNKLPACMKTYKLDDYYSCLVDLYIISSRRGITALEYALLLKFQSTNLISIEKWLPKFPVVVKAFRYLPSDSPLCRWISMLYSHLWSMDVAGDYETFCKTHKGEEIMGTAAFEKFLYGIARYQGSFVTGEGPALLSRWCYVHSHTEGSPEDKLCNGARSDNKLSVREARTKEERRQRDEAERIIKKFGCIIITKDSNSAPEYPPQTLGKRKSDSFLEGSLHKRNNYGAERGRGCGRSRGHGHGPSSFSVRFTPHPEAPDRWDSRYDRSNEAISTTDNFGGRVDSDSAHPAEADNLKRRLALAETEAKEANVRAQQAEEEKNVCLRTLDTKVELAVRDKLAEERKLPATTSLSSDDDEVADSPPTYTPSARTQALYDDWVQKRDLFSGRNNKRLPEQESTAFPDGGQDASDKRYEDLLDLMIYAQHRTTEPKFEQVVFKKWQETDISPRFGRPMPDLYIVKKAYESLPVHHVLLKHLATFFAYLWERPNWYSLEQYHIRGPAFERFLYAVCWQSSWFTWGLQDAPLWRWCEFHDHKSDKERKDCHHWRDSIAPKGWKSRWEELVRKGTESQLKLKDPYVNRFPGVGPEPNGREEETLENFPPELEWKPKTKEKEAEGDSSSESDDDEPVVTCPRAAQTKGKGVTSKGKTKEKENIWPAVPASPEPMSDWAREMTGGDIIDLGAESDSNYSLYAPPTPEDSKPRSPVRSAENRRGRGHAVRRGGHRTSSDMIR